MPAPTAPGLVHYLVNKPAGVVTTADDPQGRPTVVASCPTSPACSRWVGSTADTEGLLILTNDGDLAHLLSHPSHGVPKEYLAQVHGDAVPRRVRRLREGVLSRTA